MQGSLRVISGNPALSVQSATGAITDLALDAFLNYF